MPEVDGRLMQQVMEDREVTQAHQREIFLEVLQSKIKDQEQAEATQRLVDMAVRAGRIQAARLISKVTDVIHVSQLRELRSIAKDSGIAWSKTCEMFGFSSRTADQYLRLGDSLGDDFLTDCQSLGVSIRALETARKLPDEVRQRLTSGEVVDLEQVSKEELTEVIKDLAREHQKELAAKDEALGKEQKGREKAEAKAKETQERLEATAAELAALKAGLPADDEEAMKIVRDIEGKILPLMAVYRHTKMRGRRPDAISRILASLDLIKEAAEWTASHLGALAEGEIPDDETLSQGAERLADDIEAHDGKRPVF